MRHTAGKGLIVSSSGISPRVSEEVIEYWRDAFEGGLTDWKCVIMTVVPGNMETGRRI